MSSTTTTTSLSSSISLLSHQQIVNEVSIDSEKQQEITKRFLKGKFLGKGGFAKCYEFQEIDSKNQPIGTSYAAKIIAKSFLDKTQMWTKMEEEIEIHRTLKEHPHIVRFERTFKDHENVYILMEKCNQKSLFELLRQRGVLTEPETRYFLTQILSAVKWMHHHKIIHRDLKLANIFLSDLNVKIGDMGFACKVEFEGEKKRTMCGTPNYIAPEILLYRSHSFEVDIWAIGIILYQFLFGKPPFETKTVEATYERIKHNVYSFPDQVRVSKLATNLISKILQTNPKQRPLVDEILTDPFFQEKIPKHLPESIFSLPPTFSPLKKPLGLSSPLNKRVTIDPESILDENNSPRKTNKQINFNDAENLSPNSKPIAPRKSFLKEVLTKNMMTQKQPKLQQQETNQIEQKQEIQILKQTPIVWFMDFQSSYGIAYLLSNGTFGIHFNDFTCISISKNEEIIYSLKRNTENGSVWDSIELDIENDLKDENLDEKIRKKIDLAKHIRSTRVPNELLEKTKNIDSELWNEDVVFIDKFMNSISANIFRFSNKSIQINFNDEFKLIMSSEYKFVHLFDSQNVLVCNGELELISKQSENKILMEKLAQTRQILTLKQKYRNAVVNK